MAWSPHENAPVFALLLWVNIYIFPSLLQLKESSHLDVSFLWVGTACKYPSRINGQKCSCRMVKLSRLYQNCFQSEGANSILRSRAKVLSRIHPHQQVVLSDFLTFANLVGANGISLLFSFAFLRLLMRLSICSRVYFPYFFLCCEPIRSFAFLLLI